jgi:hypothetical protein
MWVATHRWKLERTALVKKGPNISLEIANRSSSEENDFRKVSGIVLIDTGSYRTGFNEVILGEIRARESGKTDVRVVGRDKEERPLMTCYIRFVDHDDNSSATWKSNCEIEVISLPRAHGGFGILGRDLLYCSKLTYDGTTGEVELALSEK